MARLIDADRLLRDPYFQEDRYLCSHLIRMAIGQQRTVDAVSMGVHDQVRRERDVAMEQLNEHGIPFGGIAPDVVKVVRCKDCIWFSKTGYDDENTNEDDLNLHVGHCVALRCVTQACRFCSYGEKRGDGNA